MNKDKGRKTFKIPYVTLEMSSIKVCQRVYVLILIILPLYLYISIPILKVYYHFFYALICKGKDIFK